MAIYDPTASNETIIGSNMNDIFRVTDQSFIVGDVLDGSGGFDTLLMRNITTLDVSAATSVVGIERLTGSFGDDLVTVSEANMSMFSLIDMRGGDDTLVLSGDGTYDLGNGKINSVESIAVDSTLGSTVTLDDASITIASATGANDIVIVTDPSFNFNGALDMLNAGVEEVRFVEDKTQNGVTQETTATFSLTADGAVRYFLEDPTDSPGGFTWDSIESIRAQDGTAISRTVSLDDGVVQAYSYQEDGDLEQSLFTDNSVDGSAARFQQVLTTYDDDGERELKTTDFDSGLREVISYQDGLMLDAGDAANARLIGINGGSDTFIFNSQSVEARLVRFNDGEDVIDISNLGYNDFDELQTDATISQTRANVLIDFEDGRSLTILNFDINDLDGSHFIFSDDILV